MSGGCEAEPEIGGGTLVPPLPGLRWIPESQLHFTLKFLGEIEEERVAAAGEQERIRANLQALSLIHISEPTRPY